MEDPVSSSSCELTVEVIKAVSLWDDKGVISSDRAFAAVRIEAPEPCWIPQANPAQGSDSDLSSAETAAGGSPDDAVPGLHNLESDVLPSLEENPGTFVFPFSFRAALAADQGPKACQSLLDKPLSLCVLYTPSPGVKQSVGRVEIDLSSFVTSCRPNVVSEIQGTFPVVADASSSASNQGSAAGGGKNGKRPSSSGRAGASKTPDIKTKGGATKVGSKGGEKAGKEAPPEQEVAPFPGLLPGASLEVVVKLRTPLMSLVEAEGSTVVELEVEQIHQLPAKLVEVFQADPAKDPFTYSLAFDPLPRDALPSVWQKDGQSVSESVLGGGSERGTPDIGANPLEATIATNQEPFGVMTGAILMVDSTTGQPVLNFPKPSRRYLSASQAEKLKVAIKSGAKWTAEIARYLKEDRTDVVDPLFERYHSRAEFDLSAFLKPGETLVRAKAPFLTPPLSRSEPAETSAKKDEKTGKGAKASKPQTPAPGDRPEPGRLGREPLLKPQERQDNKKAKPVEDGKGLPEGGIAVWEALGGVLGVTVKLARPLEPKWEPPPKAEIDLRTLIPERPRLDPKKDAAQVAMEAFQAVIQQTIAGLAEDIGSTTGGDVDVIPGGHVDQRARRDQLVAKLAESGKWFAIKEGMKAAVIRVAEEQSKRTGLNSDPAALYGDLYVTLLDEIHAQLNNGTKETGPTNPEAGSEVRVRLRAWAADYEASGDAEAAEKLHQDLVLEAVSGTACDWYEYGAFCLRTGQPSKAEECLREAISRDRRHVAAHVALACVLWGREQPLKAEALLQAVTGNDGAPLSDVVVAWSLLALIYAGLANRPKDVRNCLLEANRLADSRAETPGGTRTPVYVQAARLLLDYHIPELAEKALDAQRAVEDSGETADATLCAAKARRLRVDYEGAAAALEEAARAGGGDPRVYEELGHIRFAAEDFEPALEAYKTARDLSGVQPLDLVVFLNMGSIHLARGEFTEAKDVYLEACRHHPGPSTWLGAGVALLRLGDLHRAEQALAEANTLNPRNPAVWAYLALVCLRDRGREEEAAFALREALRNDVRDAKLLTEVGERCLELELFRYAEVAFRRAVKTGADPRVRRLLAETLLRQKNAKAAQLELTAALEHVELSKEDRESIEEQLKDLS